MSLDGIRKGSMIENVKLHKFGRQKLGYGYGR